MFTYLLLVRIKRDVSISIGRKGPKGFRKGFYVYAGSGRKNGFQRIIRHLKRSKKMKWHIDYLVKVGKIEKVWIILGDRFNECYLSYILREKGIILMKKFGSSDCKCPSHLFYFQNNPYKIIQSILKNDCM